MNPLELLMNNPKIIGLATGKLKTMFTEKGNKAILLRLNEENMEPPLPGFDVLMYSEDIVCITKDSWEKDRNLRLENPYAITEAEMREYEELKARYTSDGDTGTEIEYGSSRPNISSPLKADVHGQND